MTGASEIVRTAPEAELATAFRPQAPRPLSVWFRQAIADAAACAADPLYRLDMGAWHLGLDIDPTEDPDELEVLQEDVCCVCLAGSLLAQTFGASPHGTFEPNQCHIVGMPRAMSALLMAINALRCGQWD